MPPSHAGSSFEWASPYGKAERTEEHMTGGPGEEEGDNVAVIAAVLHMEQCVEHSPNSIAMPIIIFCSVHNQDYVKLSE